MEVAWFLSADSMKLLMGRGISHFVLQYVGPTPAHVFKDFPRDNQNKLQNGGIVGQGQFLGPESLTFDAQGRGPYTGVSNNRILRYDGPERAWTTSAYTSKNKFALVHLKILH
ncbi:protein STRICTOSIDINE SYNTHASE-LIKE 3-like isoform X1 [Physcomitrium patens]|uniref:Uncharacterized protein n=1 Tax=Physcomitrium patens TaxID=3218 RepID=A0A7I4ERR0_PHYPA